MSALGEGDSSGACLVLCTASLPRRRALVSLPPCLTPPAPTLSADVFKSFHSPKAYAMLQKFYVGELEPAAMVASAPAASAPVDLRPFEVAYRALHAQAVAEGLFKAKCVCGCG